MWAYHQNLIKRGDSEGFRTIKENIKRKTTKIIKSESLYNK